jgi:tRNA G10  N-methylase Trm11
MQSLLILGRQPELGLAELESLYGSDKLTPVGKQAVIVDVDPCLLAFKRLGGSIKFCKVLSTLDTTDWKAIESFLIKVAPNQTANMPEGKMNLGLSLYDFKIPSKSIMASGLKIKKAISATGRSVRLIPNKEQALNSAQVTHNKLLSDRGWELIFIKDQDKTVIAQSVMVQDIDSYTKRDRVRPKRDARVGMLPPKLAQIIINLAVGKLEESKLMSICDIPADEQVPAPNLEQTILDPFCGTGVLVQEAMLMGYSTYASDIEKRMTDYTDENIDWLKDSFKLGDVGYDSAVADATSYQWSERFDFVASELFLGEPLHNMPSKPTLDRIIDKANQVVEGFLKNLHPQTEPGFRLAIAVPAWVMGPNELSHLPVIDRLTDMGYNLMSFKHASSKGLAYYRPDQLVARELLVLTRI